MTRAVFDTNILISYLLTHRPPISTLIDRHLGQRDFSLVTAPELLEELNRVLRYPKLQGYYSEGKRKRFVDLCALAMRSIPTAELISLVLKLAHAYQITA